MKLNFIDLHCEDQTAYQRESNFKTAQKFQSEKFFTNRMHEEEEIQGKGMKYQSDWKTRTKVVRDPLAYNMQCLTIAVKWFESS